MGDNTTAALIFQFHKGTIRTFKFSQAGLRLRNFNSIKVRLELLLHILPIILLRYFNSIKVRLEQESKVNRSLAVLFQFHKGTIRTH